MSADPVLMLLDWWSQLLKEHVQVEAERDRWECGGDHDPMDYEAHWAWVKQRMDDNEAGKSRDLGTPPGCFGQTAFERVTAIIIGRLPDQPFTVERLREFLAAGNLGPSDDPGFLETKRALEGMDLGLLAKELRREFDREPLPEHATWLAEFCELVEAQQFAPSAASEPAGKKPSIDAHESGPDFSAVQGLLPGSNRTGSLAATEARLIRRVLDRGGAIPLGEVLAELEWDEGAWSATQTRVNKKLQHVGFRLSRRANEVILHQRTNESPTEK